MLSTLLPGVREFRTPLVTGLLWAACLWLLVGRPISDSNATSDFVSDFRLDQLPSTVWLGAAALLVYLVGSLLVVRKSPIEPLVVRFRPWVARMIDRLDEDRAPAKRRHRWLWKKWRDKWSYRRPVNRARSWCQSEGIRWQAVDGWLHNEFQAMLSDGHVPVMRSFDGGCNAPNGFEGFYAADTVESHPAYGINSDQLRSSLSENFVREVKDERPAVEVRIQMRFPEVYAEIDRLKVEAELRMSIFWPLIVLTGILAVAWSPLALAFVLVPPWLLWDGIKRSHEATEKTWAPLVAGEVTSPILDAMAAAKNGEFRNFRSRYGVRENSDAETPIHVS
ncbi:hypothetical protein [Nocardioides sp. zg-DK7169]|uniref:hypothetical protein n=1 Tax=Nocardioides sp. zg-DK7169 TaxID=2736600 RepID=UPI001553F538|nr:hypothetical protein [Nocardioides sp. zg-DK7169]NPC97882.1 hypothetical protein [Nocardioides sp. zg-DK7169]